MSCVSYRNLSVKTKKIVSERRGGADKVGECCSCVFRPGEIAALGDDKSPRQLYKNWLSKYFVNCVVGLVVDDGVPWRRQPQLHDAHVLHPTGRLGQSVRGGKLCGKIPQSQICCQNL